MTRCGDVRSRAADVRWGTCVLSGARSYKLSIILEGLYMHFSRVRLQTRARPNSMAGTGDRRRLPGCMPRGVAQCLTKRWALSVPLDGFTLAEHADIAREAERLGYRDAWSFEVDGVDCFSPLAVVAGATNLRVGTAIANVFTRGPPRSPARPAASPRWRRAGSAWASAPAPSRSSRRGTAARSSKPGHARARDGGVPAAGASGRARGVRGETFPVDGFRLSRRPAGADPDPRGRARTGHAARGGRGRRRRDRQLAVRGRRRNSPSASSGRPRARAGRDPDAIEITARLMVNVDPPCARVRHWRCGGTSPPTSTCRSTARSTSGWARRGARPDVGGVGRGDRKAALAAVPERGRAVSSSCAARWTSVTRGRAPLPRRRHRHRVPKPLFVRPGCERAPGTNVEGHPGDGAR